MQWLCILRGCLAAYVFGVIVMALGSVIVDQSGLEPVGVIALFGAFLLILLSIVAVVIWAVLAGLGKVVTIGQTIAICAGVFFFIGFLLGIADGSLLAIVASLLVAPLIGCVFGAVFWVGAFGRRREMQMGTPPPDGDEPC